MLNLLEKALRLKPLACQNIHKYPIHILHPEASDIHIIWSVSITPCYGLLGSSSASWSWSLSESPSPQVTHFQGAKQQTDSSSLRHHGKLNVIPKIEYMKHTHTHTHTRLAERPENIPQIEKKKSIKWNGPRRRF